MKFAVISDIHGNMQALDAVLNDIKKENCSSILCLGDLAMAGPEPAKAVELIKSIAEDGKMTVIQGNTDYLISNFDSEVTNRLAASFPIMSEALKNDIQVIPDYLKEYLKNLPVQKTLEIEGVKVLLVHGSPRKNDENIMPDLPIEKVEEMLEGVVSDLIFCGHTHIPCGFQTTNKQTVVNVGSVGRPFTPEPKACYAIVDFKNNGFEVSHKFVEYDNNLASKILSKRHFQGADKLAQILIKPEFRHM